MRNTLKKINAHNSYRKIYNPFKERENKIYFLWWGYLGKSYDNVL